jgi:hypothetical protein
MVGVFRSLASRAATCATFGASAPASLQTRAFNPAHAQCKTELSKAASMERRICSSTPSHVRFDKSVDATFRDRESAKVKTAIASRSLLSWTACSSKYVRLEELARATHTIGQNALHIEANDIRRHSVKPVTSSSDRLFMIGSRRAIF